MVDTSDEACAVACMLVSNPQGAMRQDGDGWEKRVNDLIRALRDERNTFRKSAPELLTAFNVWKNDAASFEVFDVFKAGYKAARNAG